MINRYAVRRSKKTVRLATTDEIKETHNSFLNGLEEGLKNSTRNLTSNIARIEINSACSAQPSTATPNPIVEVAIKYCLETGLISRDSNKPRIADQGCGNLRHLTILCRYFDTIYLADKEFQLNRLKRLFGLDGTNIKEYISSLKMSGKKFTVLSDLVF
jgi:hypothetical protein